MAWYSDSKLVASFGAALVNAGVLEDGDDFRAFLMTPQRWDDEFNAWKDTGYPTDEDDDEWEGFILAIGGEDEDEEEEEPE